MGGVSLLAIHPRYREALATNTDYIQILLISLPFLSCDGNCSSKFALALLGTQLTFLLTHYRLPTLGDSPGACAQHMRLRVFRCRRSVLLRSRFPPISGEKANLRPFASHWNCSSA